MIFAFFAIDALQSACQQRVGFIDYENIDEESGAWVA